MNRFITVLMLSLSLVSSAFAFDIEKKMFLSQHIVSYTTSYEISSPDKRLGTIYRRFFSLNTKYDFYDTKKNLISSAHSRFFSFGAHFDIYDDTETNILGTVEEKIFAFFPTFDLYAKDGTRLGQAKMNFWGTDFILYGDVSHTQILAVMSRSFFRWKHDWTIKIRDMERVKAKNIDPRFLMTVLAIQGDQEDLARRRREEEARRRREEETRKHRQGEARRYRQNHNDHKLQSRQLAQVLPLAQSMQAKIKAFIQQEESIPAAPMDEDNLDALSRHLDEKYQQLYATSSLSAEAETEQFVDYCLNEARAPGTTPETKKAILDLLQKRINEA
ncbi:MAG: hypothetical protein NXI01_04935 [Gammaproteobacteria bacterium]|nr:hypothetical protein [Gammaproteobacteria bacterium]